MDPRTILVDGYNVIRNTPGLAAAEHISLQHGREALLRQIAARYRHTPHRVIVVFDGDGDRESTYALPGMPRGQIIFSQADESADQVIRRLSEREQAAGIGCVVVSDDFEVRAAVQAHGGKGAGAQDLSRRLGEPSRFQRRQYQHRSYLQQQWQKDSDDGHVWTAGSGRKQKRRPHQVNDDYLR
jgi:uncharacterized protein